MTHLPDTSAALRIDAARVGLRPDSHVAPSGTGHRTWFSILFASAALISTACTESAELRLDPAFPGQALTVTLQPDTTELWLEDYVMDVTSISEIQPPRGLSYSLTDDSRLLLYGDMALPLDMLTLRVDGAGYSIPLRRSEVQYRQLTLDPRRLGYDPGAGSDGLPEVRMKGEMNSWNPAAHPMVWDGEVFRTRFPVKPGRYQYQFLVNGRETLDPANPERVGNGMGGMNSLLTVAPLSEEPRPTIRIESLDTPRSVVVRSQYADTLLALWENTTLTVRPMPGATGETLVLHRIELPADMDRFALSHLRAWAVGPGGASHEAVLPIVDGQPVTDASAITRHDPRGWRMYFILIDRFADGNPDNTAPLNIPEVHPKADYYGGDFAGITQRIREGYFDSLGVNALWLSPISRNPDGPYGLYPEPETRFSGYHGYWPVSSSQLDPRFGTEQEFRELLDTAHSHGISVILDYVANHVHELHPVIQQNPDWKTDLYLPDGTLNTERWDEYRLTTWFDVFMPTLDFSRPEVVDAMTDSALFWIQEFPLDGFRHDATKHIQTAFWRTLTRKMKEQVTVPGQRPLYQIGETYGSRDLIASYIGTGLLDAQFDFALYDAGLAAFARGESMANLRGELQQSFDAYGVHNRMGYISGNHDKPRFITLASGEVSFSEDAKYAGWTRQIGYPGPQGYRRHAMNVAFIFTIPGIPVLYQGDEFGMPGANDPDNRRMMLFADSLLQPAELEMRETTTRLANLRRASLPLTYGDFTFLHTDEHTMAFQRSYLGESAFVFFNNDDSPRTLEVEPTADLPDDLSALRSNFGHAVELDARGMLRITLPAESFEVVTLDRP